jgi:hypothetical protein
VFWLGNTDLFRIADSPWHQVAWLVVDFPICHFRLKSAQQCVRTQLSPQKVVLESVAQPPKPQPAVRGWTATYVCSAFQDR